MPFVLDASMAASWAFTDESTAVTQQAGVAVLTV